MKKIIRKVGRKINKLFIMAAIDKPFFIIAITFLCIALTFQILNKTQVNKYYETTGKIVLDDMNKYVIRLDGADPYSDYIEGDEVLWFYDDQSKRYRGIVQYSEFYNEYVINININDLQNDSYNKSKVRVELLGEYISLFERLIED